jgi:uncharacterized membrane protein
MKQAEIHDSKLLERLSIFNDAVYAIVPTILVLDFHTPVLHDKASNLEMLERLHHLTPKFFAFLLSTILVGGNWLAGLNIQRILVKTNEFYPIYVVIYLIIISLLPFCCSLIGNYPDNPISYVVFGIFSSALCVCAYFYMRNIIKNALHHQNADLLQLRKLQKQLPIMIIFAIILSAIAYINTTLSFVLFLLLSLIPIFWAKPIKLDLKKS